MSNGKINGKQIVDDTVVKTINGMTFSDQFLTASGDANVTASVSTSGTTHSFIVSWIGNIVNVGGGRANNTSNAYLNGVGGEFMNITPFILPFNARLTNISAANTGIETWIGEVHTSGTVVTGATISIVATSSAWATYSINFNAGDRVMLYCNGSVISSPRIDAIFLKR